MASDDVRALFAVTTLHGGDPSNWRPRTPGIFTTVEKARDVVTRNVLDLHEFYYEYAVIETIAVDTLYPPVHEAYAAEWYRWTGERYERCDTPDDFKRGVGFSIG